MRIIIAAAALLLAAPVLAQDAALSKFQEEARKTSAEFGQKLGAELKKSLEAGGPEAAIGVCKDIAPAISSDLSRKKGWRVTRVSLKTRDPLLGLPDAWEQKVLADFDQRAAAGEKPETLEFAEVVSEPQGKSLRYMKAIPTQELCLTCHGPTDTIPTGMKQKLAEQYPHDRATGYRVGQVRGAFSIKQPQ
ncbi:MAG TPA: DUF3365 domain-containing protein [Burkholderiales bacterium]|nr:DUF3365 domain-containing protein [Burkholderiales bacterium]